MLPFASALKRIPSSTGESAPASAVVGAAVEGQMVKNDGGGATVMLNAWIAVCCGAPPSATCTENEKVPVTLGTPLIFPPGVSVSPGGSTLLIRDQLYGAVPPVAAVVTE